MRTYKEIFSSEIEEHEKIHSKYRRKKTKAQSFEEWKALCCANQRLPRQKVDDKYEKSLYGRIHNCIFRMRKDNAKYITQIQEYEQICSEYRA